MDAEDEFAWNALMTRGVDQSVQAAAKFLKGLEKALRCEICGELMDVPMAIASCGHTYCSGYALTSAVVVAPS